MIKRQRVQKGAPAPRARVDGALARGLWPPVGGRLCSLRSGGDSACGAEGGGGSCAADYKKGGAAGAAGCVEGLRRFAQGATALRAEGGGIALSGDEYKVSVTGLAYCVI